MTARSALGYLLVRMGWFRQSFGQSKDYQKISTLEEGLKSLEKDFKALELEWINTYDKLRTLMGRISKRTAIMEASQPPEEAETEMVDGAPIIPTEPLLGLTKRQQAINTAILRSRGIRA